jgi:hypothetical protein
MDRLSRMMGGAAGKKFKKNHLDSWADEKPWSSSSSQNLAVLGDAFVYKMWI